MWTTDLSKCTASLPEEVLYHGWLFCLFYCQEKYFDDDGKEACQTVGKRRTLDATHDTKRL